MCYDYADGPDDNGDRHMRLEVSDKAILKKISVGTRSKFQISGEIVEVEAPRMVPDYSVDPPRTNGKRPSNWTRPKKELPGRVKLRLDKGDPDIELLNAHLMDEESD
jgi:hypothetical protein